MATIKQENVINIIVDGKGKRFEESGLRDLVIFELHTTYNTVGTSPYGAISISREGCTSPIRYMDFINPYWWDDGDGIYSDATEADAIRKDKGDVIISFKEARGMYLSCPFGKDIRKTRRFRSVLEREVIRHFVSHKGLRAVGAFPGSFETFEISSISKDEVCGTLARYIWVMPRDEFGRLANVANVAQFWTYGGLERKETQQYCIKFVNCPITAWG